MASMKELTPQHLHTPRLTLERFDSSSAEHFACVLACFNSKATIAMSGDWGVRTPAQYSAYKAGVRLRGARFTDGVADDDLTFLLRLGPASGGELMGAVFVSQRACRVGSTEATAQQVLLPPDVGFNVLERFHGQGYASEAVREVVRWLREGFGVEEIIVMTKAVHERAVRVAERAGFVDGGRIENFDQPGTVLQLLKLPEMKDFQLEGGISFK